MTELVYNQGSLVSEPELLTSVLYYVDYTFSWGGGSNNGRSNHRLFNFMPTCTIMYLVNNIVFPFK